MITNFKNETYKENVCLFISMVLFYDYKFAKTSIQENERHFISIVLFYDRKFSKMGIQRKCVSFYFCGSFL